MNYRITHRTLYEYAAPVTVSHHVTRLEPRAINTQSCEAFSLKIFPEPTLRKSRQDYFGNRLCFFAIQEIHTRLEIVTHSRVTVIARKLPAPVSRVTYDLEYGTDTLEIHLDAIRPGQRVVLVDDLLATGGTMEATVKLVNQLGGEIAGLAFAIELEFLHGREKLRGYDVLSLLKY